MLSESLNAASSPFLYSDVIVHNTIGIGTANSIGISEDGLWRSKRINEVMVHAKVVPQFMANDL